MGEVYLAQDMKLGRKVALKLLPADLSLDENRLHRFEQEARLASNLTHPNICVIHEVNETEDSRHFIVMEYIDGVTLRQYMTEKQIGLSEALDIVTQVASALSAAHEAGIVHRDIKPENIMIRRDGYVKVLDFGLAKLTEGDRANSDPLALTKSLVETGAGVVIGTVCYMSPEQARGAEVDAQTQTTRLTPLLRPLQLRTRHLAQNIWSQKSNDTSWPPLLFSLCLRSRSQGFSFFSATEIPVARLIQSPCCRSIIRVTTRIR